MFPECERRTVVVNDSFHEHAQLVAFQLRSRTGVRDNSLQLVIHQPTLFEFEVEHLLARRRINETQTRYQTKQRAEQRRAGSGALLQSKDRLNVECGPRLEYAVTKVFFVTLHLC